MRELAVAHFVQDFAGFGVTIIVFGLRLSAPRTSRLPRAKSG